MTIDAQQAVTRTLSDVAAEEIRALLGRKRMSQAELARRLNMTGAWLNYRLTGRQPIDLNDLQLIAAVLKVQPSDLLVPGSAITGWYRASKSPLTKVAGQKTSSRMTARPPAYPHAGRRPQLLSRRSH